MDLTIDVNNNVLNIRVTILLETEEGYLFEKSDEGFFFPIGGRVKMMETSLEAAKRELQEETGLEDISFDFTAILESYFTFQDQHFHEINFVYLAKYSDKLNLDKGFIAIQKDALVIYDIRPSYIKKIITNKSKTPVHKVLRGV